MKASAGNSIINNDINIVIHNLGETSFQHKTIVVTGGAGFLGSWICDVLIEQGARVICLDNLSSGLKTNISHLLQKDKFKFIEHDVTQLIHISEKIDIVLWSEESAKFVCNALSPAEISEVIIDEETRTMEVIVSLPPACVTFSQYWVRNS